MVLNVQGRRLEINTSLVGKHNLYNILAAAAFGLSQGIDFIHIKKGIEEVASVPGRLERIDSLKGFSVFVDYAHTPDALTKALQALRPYVSGGLHVAFGCGGDRDKGKRPEMGRAAVAGADLIVAGAPVLGFRVPSAKMLEMIRQSNEKVAPDLSHPPMGAWLDALPAGKGRSAAFETRIWWSPGGSTGGLERGLESKGYARLTKAQRFIVTGKYGPLREGELEKARAWGAELAQAMKS